MQTKLSREFTTAVASFQRVQRLSAEKQRSHVESQKRRVEELVEDDGWVLAEVLSTVYELTDRVDTMSRGEVSSWNRYKRNNRPHSECNRAAPTNSLY